MNRIEAVNLYELILDNHSGTNEKSLNTELFKIKWHKNNPLLFSFLAKGYESYSSPKGHIVVIKFSKDKQQMLMKDCKVVCTCPAFLYWGSKYNATVGEYNYRTSTNIPPDIRDPNRERKVCKHIAATRQYLRNLTGKTVHKKYKRQFDEIPSVKTQLYTRVKASADTLKEIAFDDMEVIEALSDFTGFNDGLSIIGNDAIFEATIENLLEQGI